MANIAKAAKEDWRRHDEKKKQNGNKSALSDGLSDIDPYNLECLAMAIVNHTNDQTGASVETRQITNDKNFDYAIKTIKVFLKENGR